MDNSLQGMLVGSEIHGFHTLKDLDVGNIMEEAKMRWLRPNEIHAILCNHKYFSIKAKPVHLPPGGTIELFDRKVLRNFRKDGHNWKKKKDGKTVKEAHEHLKVGNEERIHVYYAHGQDTPTFVRRCYWLLDKSLEHIVLVHYRETQEVQLQGSPATPVNSNSSSVSDHSSPWRFSEDLDSESHQALYVGENELLAECCNKLTVKHYEQRLHEINTLEWDELLVTDDLSNTPKGGDKVLGIHQQNQVAANDSTVGGGDKLLEEISTLDNASGSTGRNNKNHFSLPNSSYVSTMVSQLNSNSLKGNTIAMASNVPLDIMANEGLQSQDSFGRWINDIISDSPGSVDNPVFESSILPNYDEFTSATINHHQSSVPEQMFTITDISPGWAFTVEKTKILITGLFHEEFAHLANSSLLCVCGDVCIPTEVVQLGVYRCLVPPHPPGCVNIYLSLDGHKPISQVMNFEYRNQLLDGSGVSFDKKERWDEFQVQLRLLGLLFSTSKSLTILSSKVSQNALKVARNFAQKTSNIANSWAYLYKSIQDKKISIPLANDGLLEIILRNRVREWLLEKIIEGSKKSTEFDAHGQGVIHLCAILGYTWAIQLFGWSGLTLDFRDKSGWTALHWAAYCGREKMAAVLLYAGAKPNLVTDPTSENPGGCTAADLAYVKGHDGLAAYLSEKALVAHFHEMSIAGNISGTLQISTTERESVNTENLSEEQLYMKDTLAAYRTAADAASRINAAFREHSYKQRTKEVEVSTPEMEARNIIAAMKIQHAFRNYEMRRKMAAAAHIQHRFRTWKLRKEFLNMRRQAIRIQAAFRGFQVRRHYHKIIWSVGVLEKAILRWRLKRKGFRGLQVEPVEPIAEERQESDVEEDFYRTSQKQASERVERAVVRVQALFRSRKAQEDYQKMKMAHLEAMLEYDGVFDPDCDMHS